MSSSFYRPDLLELAAGYAEDAVMVTTAELDLPGPQIVYVNPAFTRMTGFQTAELVGKTPRILQGKGTCRETLNRLRQELLEGRDFIARTKNYRRDGSEFEIEWIISHIRNDAGQTTYYVAIQRDITGKERAKDQLRKFDAELEKTSQSLLQSLRSLELAEQRAIKRERLAALGEMAAGVAHDLKNGLAPISSVIQVLEKSETLSVEDQALVETLKLGTEHAADMVNNLRHFYQTDSGDAQLESVDLKEVAESVRSITQAKWESHPLVTGSQIQFSLNLQDVPPVRGNPIELRQVLINLVFNAVEAMDRGGELKINLYPVADEVIVEVVDTGRGMSPAEMERCFEPYMTTKPDGNGFGLSYCHGVISKYGGRIEVETPVRQTEPIHDPQLNTTQYRGTLFRISLPRDKAPGTGPQRKALRILCIDDVELARRSTKALLESMGHSVDIAAGGETGLQLWASGEYDVLLTDYQMSPVSGAQVLQHVKAVQPKFPVILMTGSNIRKASAFSSSDAHPDYILEKPFTIEEVAAALQETLGQ